jgi:hypothetical protein
MKFHENPSSGGELFHADRQKDGQRAGTVYLLVCLFQYYFLTPTSFHFLLPFPAFLNTFFFPVKFIFYTHTHTHTHTHTQARARTPKQSHPELSLFIVFVVIHSNPPQNFATGSDLIFSLLSGHMDVTARNRSFS